MQYLLTQEEYDAKAGSGEKEIQALKAELKKANEIIEKFRNPLETMVTMNQPTSADPLAFQGQRIYTITYRPEDLDEASLQKFYTMAKAGIDKR